MTRPFQNRRAFDASASAAPVPPPVEDLRLHDAASAGRLDEVKALVAEGLHPLTVVKRAMDGMGTTALHAASGTGQAEVVAYFITLGLDVDFIAVDMNTRHTALMSAVIGGRGEVVGLLLAAGADPDKRDFKMDTALHMASERGHVGIVAQLIAAGAARDARDRFDQRAQDVACNRTAPMDALRKTALHGDILELFRLADKNGVQPRHHRDTTLDHDMTAMNPIRLKKPAPKGNRRAA